MLSANEIETHHRRSTPMIKTALHARRMDSPSELRADGWNGATGGRDRWIESDGHAIDGDRSRVVTVSSMALTIALRTSGPNTAEISSPTREICS